MRSGLCEAWRPLPHCLCALRPAPFSLAVDSRALAKDTLMSFVLSTHGQGALNSRASAASRASGASNPVSEPRSVTGANESWLLRFSDLRIVRPIGEGSFGKARWGCREEGALMLACHLRSRPAPASTHLPLAACDPAAARRCTWHRGTRR